MSTSLEANPYAAPATPLDSPPPITSGRDEAIAIRRAHLSHEASIQGLGALWIFGSILMAGSLAFSLANKVGVGEMTIIGALLMGLFVCALDVRKLHPRARVTGSILAAFALLGFPMGTFIGLYALHLFHGAKGRVVLGPDYARIRELTPEIRYRTSIVVKIAGALLLAVILFAAGAALFG